MFRKKPTLSQVFDELCLEHYSKPQFVHSGYGTEVRQNWRRHLATTKLADTPIHKVTPPMVWRWHQGLRNSPYDANRAKSILSKVFNFAMMRGFLPVGANPCSAVPSFEEKKRKRFASWEELRRLGAILEREEPDNPRHVAFIRLLMFTGSRPSAIERSTWNDFYRLGDDCGVLRVKGKTGDEEIILPPPAIGVIDHLADLGKCRTITGIAFPSSFWKRVRKEAGCEDLWARDFRRTFATLGLSTGVPLGMLGELLNHKSNQTTMRYAKLTPDSRVQAASRIAEEMLRRME